MRLTHFSFFLLTSTVYAARLGDKSGHVEREGQRMSRGLSTNLTYVGRYSSDPSAFPLGLCEGDCKTDSDCQEGLKCFQRNGTEPVPGCSGIGNSGLDYCFNATYDATASITSNSSDGSDSVGNSSAYLSTSYYIHKAKCEGDCDDDSDCQHGLQCFFRSGTEMIPGCLGGGVPRKDYCYDPNDDYAGDTSTSFRLKMHWQEGYDWQDETFERKWCLGCGEAYTKCAIHTCGGSSTKFEFVKESLAYKIQVSETNLCLQRFNYFEVEVRNCSSTDRRQLWTGEFESSIFEINPAGGTNLCVTPPHHPRMKEEVSCYHCDAVRSFDTSLWEKY